MSGSSVVRGIVAEVRGEEFEGLYEFNDLGVVGRCGSGGSVGGGSGDVRGDGNGNRHRGLLSGVVSVEFNWWG